MTYPELTASVSITVERSGLGGPVRVRMRHHPSGARAEATAPTELGARRACAGLLAVRVCEIEGITR